MSSVSKPVLASPAAPAGPSRGPRVGDEPLRGIALVVCASIFFSISDATAKYVTETLPVIEVAWVRYVVFTLLATLPALRDHGAMLRTRRPVTQVMRGLAIVGSALLFVYGLQELPLADAAAINFVSPLFITVLSVPFLGEVVGPRRWAAVGVGLTGAVIAAQPGTSAFSVAAIYPVLSAATWAIGIILTRRMASTEGSATIIAWTAISGLVLLTGLLPFQAVIPTERELVLCVLIGVMASVGQGLVVLGYRTAPASLLAPFSYLQLIWSTSLGYIVFAARPSLPTLIGATVIAASGLYSAHRERQAR